MPEHVIRAQYLCPCFCVALCLHAKERQMVTFFKFSAVRISNLEFPTQGYKIVKCAHQNSDLWHYSLRNVNAPSRPRFVMDPCKIWVQATFQFQINKQKKNKKLYFAQNIFTLEPTYHY